MGTSTNAQIVYGFEVEEDTLDHERCNQLMDEDYSSLTKLEKELGLELVYHCSGDFPLYIVGLASTYAIAYRGDVKELDPWAMTRMDTEEMDGQLAKIAMTLGITPKPGKWCLTSYWG